MTEGELESLATKYAGKGFGIVGIENYPGAHHLMGRRIKIVSGEMFPEMFVTYSKIRTVSATPIAEELVLGIDRCFAMLSFRIKPANYLEIAKLEREEGKSFEDLKDVKMGLYSLNYLRFKVKQEIWITDGTLEPPPALLQMHDLVLSRIFKQMGAPAPLAEYGKDQPITPTVFDGLRVKVELIG